MISTLHADSDSLSQDKEFIAIAPVPRR